jgi:hypothetical protein
MADARLWFIVLAGVTLSSCDVSERNVITDTAPFFQTEVPINGARTDVVIQAVQAFSVQHHMDFLLAQDSLPPGDFNASANGASLNLRAMHSAPLDKGVDISAVARGYPTAADQALIQQFVVEIRESAIDTK